MPQPSTVEIDGTAIRRIRMSNGTEMRDLAQSAGITRSYLCRIETGSRRHLRPRTYAALRDSLGVTDDQVLAKDPTEEDDMT